MIILSVFVLSALIERNDEGEPIKYTGTNISKAAIPKLDMQPLFVSFELTINTSQSVISSYASADHNLWTLLAIIYGF